MAVQIFDQKKFKKRDQGFLGVINIPVSQVIDLELGGKGELWAARRARCMDGALTSPCQSSSRVT